MHDALSDSTLVALDIAPISSSANVNGTVMDMQGWDGIQYAFQLGTMASGATYDARIVSSANANMSGATNITNAALVQVAVTGNANIYVIDVWRPTDRYLRSATQPATAAVLHTSIATRYRRNGVLPPTQVAIQQVKVASN
jgi:hypothetical protein